MNSEWSVRFVARLPPPPAAAECCQRRLSLTAGPRGCGRAGGEDAGGGLDPKEFAHQLSNDLHSSTEPPAPEPPTVGVLAAPRSTPSERLEAALPRAARLGLLDAALSGDSLMVSDTSGAVPGREGPMVGDTSGTVPGRKGAMVSDMSGAVPGRGSGCDESSSCCVNGVAARAKENPAPPPREAGRESWVGVSPTEAGRRTRSIPVAGRVGSGADGGG